MPGLKQPSRFQVLQSRVMQGGAEGRDTDYGGKRRRAHSKREILIPPDFFLSHTPVFHTMQQVTSTKVFISNCYSLLLGACFDKYPCKARSSRTQWELDVEELTGDQCEEAMEAVCYSSLNALQRLSQLYILLLRVG